MRGERGKTAGSRWHLQPSVRPLTPPTALAQPNSCMRMRPRQALSWAEPSAQSCLRSARSCLIACCAARATGRTQNPSHSCCAVTIMEHMPIVAVKWRGASLVIVAMLKLSYRASCTFTTLLWCSTTEANPAPVVEQTLSSTLAQFMYTRADLGFVMRCSDPYVSASHAPRQFVALGVHRAMLWSLLPST